MPHIQLWQTVVMDIHKLCMHKMSSKLICNIHGAELSTNTDADQFCYFFQYYLK